MSENYMFHKAARDGYLDLLREATRSDCNRIDEDGMTPTLWAAYNGNLHALRLIVGRGGNPDKCDYFGSSALHHAALNGHMNCVTFLVSFGTNLWALDNELRTPLDVAGLTGRREIVRYLDSVYADQAQLNKKMVKKWKEKAILDAQKRIKKTSKLRKKAAKEAIAEDQKLTKLFSKHGTGTAHRSAPSSLHATVRSNSAVSSLSGKSHFLEPKPYSAHFTITSENKKLFMSGVAKKIRQKSREATPLEKGEFKVRHFDSDGTRSVRSLSGLKRDPHVMYVRGRFDGSVSSTDSGNSRDDLFKVYPKAPDAVSRALSEPDFFYNGDSGIDMPDSPEPCDRASIFERPGFGSVAFMNHRVLSSLPQDCYDIKEDMVQTDERNMKKGKGKSQSKRREDGGSIGTVGSLAVRMKDLPWGDDIVDDLPSHSDLELFLAAHKLSEYFMLFRQEDIDLQSLMLLSEKDLKDIGLPMGPRRKLLEAVNKRKDALNKSGTIIDTPL